jgi:hypothetical protein
MNPGIQIPEPIMFNPLKHHLGFIKEFISNTTSIPEDVIKQLKHIGTSVMDIYTGALLLPEVYLEICTFLERKDLLSYHNYSGFIGSRKQDFRVMTLSDDSQWMLNFNNNRLRYAHIFPARYSPHTIRIKSNTLKSALLFMIFIGKDFISGDDLNNARSKIGLSPVKDPLETEAITEMIELLRF